MNDTKTNVIIFIFSCIPYFLVSWGYTALIDGGLGDFWRAFGVLVALRLFFSIIETFGSVISWLLYGKKLMVNKFLEMLRANNFPKREYADDNFTNYLSRIEDGLEYNASVRTAAKEIYFFLATFESMGILLGMRMHSAAEEALDVYSPKSRAPMFDTNHT